MGDKHYPGHRYFTMYHGTTMDKAMKILNEGFIPSADGMLGRGVYLSRSFEKASRYPVYRQAGEQLAVLKLSVRVGKVKRIDYQGHPMQKTWHDHGYDTAWVPANCGMVPSGLEEDCVYEPWRIKVQQVLSADQTAAGGGHFPENETLNDRCGGILKNMCRNFHIGLTPCPVYPGHRVYTMYHGTTLSAALQIKRYGFRRSTGGMLGAGVYVSRSFHKASHYPLYKQPGQRLAVLKLSVSVGKVKKINRQGHPLQKTWHLSGYDTAWVPPNCGMVPSGLEEDCVWEPRRIRVLEVIPR
ncbi:grass carp reovirus (GCRV)-induced gene 2q [Pygocentrus nattereri]|uniref:grass carp reovirus (GCRV)-induced gene 2q n=1 Tax=Pygocentrus nattereri TaxID=42514 RepID=UPI00081471BC|nr:grass carp reovirus (GCRV)-induced gene 2q [Pygocentrus nattereri]